MKKLHVFILKHLTKIGKIFSNNRNGSENHFGLFTVDGKAKYALWKNVDNGDFNGLNKKWKLNY